MFRKAYEIAGVRISNEIFTHSEFHTIRQKNPNITLDEAILIFEHAPINVSLEQFAQKKHRTAASYRKVFREFFAPFKN